MSGMAGCLKGIDVVGPRIEVTCMALSRTAAEPPDDLFAAWVQQASNRTRTRGLPVQPTLGPIRFAFYGRMSTTGYQDPVSSRQWQHDNATRLIAGYGLIAAEFFDAGFSRSLPWHQRSAAAELLAEAARSDRRFDAVVIGEYERAFTGGQARQIIPHLQALGVTVWLPEAHGPVDPDEPAHQALLVLLGHQSEREVLRFRMRTTTAMRAQAGDQDRHLGGRPPYGYRLVDAGPRPNQTHAAWGRRVHRLEVDPLAAVYVRWIFERRLAGASAASIARVLNERRFRHRPRMIRYAIRTERERCGRCGRSRRSWRTRVTPATTATSQCWKAR
jgi:DNA invertase Pin-like site-specific DNA recombinase